MYKSATPFSEARFYNSIGMQGQFTDNPLRVRGIELESICTLSNDDVNFISIPTYVAGRLFGIVGLPFDLAYTIYASIKDKRANKKMQECLNTRVY